LTAQKDPKRRSLLLPENNLPLFFNKMSDFQEKKIRENHIFPYFSRQGMKGKPMSGLTKKS